MITFQVQDRQGDRRTIEVPEDINLTLMEVLKASDYPVLATCGGMALCATCHVEVQQGHAHLGPPTDAEGDMIDTLPNATHTSRLACQIRIGGHLENALFILME
ncbi:MAG TPA: 2Fe-2S iron-sulfur cluster-binding protein [Ohtaekwangia sp.]|nr:2Fe-2S iron-sulfur cluster-binding protein [Ohtaekwangia sp.]